MNIKNYRVKYLAVIEDFFLGKLKGEELKDFTRELKSNQELKNEFEIYERAIDFVNTQENRLINDISRLKDFEFNPEHLLDIKKYGTKETLGNNEEKISDILQNEHTYPGISKKRQVFIRSAAIITLIIGLTITMLLLFPGYKSNEDLFLKSYSPYSHSLNTRSSNTSYTEQVMYGLRFYDKGDYVQALSYFVHLPDSLVGNSELCITLGVCFIENQDYNSAIQTLEKVENNCLLYPTSLWYQGLCFLKLNDNRNAQKVFKELESLDPCNLKDTKKILKYMKP